MAVFGISIPASAIAGEWSSDSWVRMLFPDEGHPGGAGSGRRSQKGHFLQPARHAEPGRTRRHPAVITMSSTIAAARHRPGVRLHRSRPAIAVTAGLSWLVLGGPASCGSPSGSTGSAASRRSWISCVHLHRDPIRDHGVRDPRDGTRGVLAAIASSSSPSGGVNYSFTLWRFFPALPFASLPHRLQRTIHGETSCVTHDHHIGPARLGIPERASSCGGGFNIDIQPPLGPTGHDYVTYYYLPDIRGIL